MCFQSGSSIVTNKSSQTEFLLGLGILLIDLIYKNEIISL